MPTNFARTALLLGLLTVIFVAMGSIVGGKQGMVIAFVIALGMNLMALWRSDKVVLTVYRAREVGPADAPGFHGIVQELAAKAGLPMPKVFIMDNPQPNAFATGRNPANAAVCASTGLLDALSPEEISGVMAHELAHVHNRDTLTMTVAATIAGAISMLANWLQFSMFFGGSRDNRGNWLTSLALMIIAPFAAMLVQMAISRSREYQADRLGGMICGNPMWLASALARIEHMVRGGSVNVQAEQVPATAPLFIINPLTGRGFDNLFQTHPSTANRIQELQKLAQEMANAGTLVTDAPGGAASGYGQHTGGGFGTDTPPPGPWSRPRGPWG
ncbi:MAG: zinc metalloprotease HtpX [Hyphomicrobiaceae bacterium]